MSELALLKKELQSCIRPEKVSLYQRFFKTGPGEYGEGDVFIGITVPDQRKVARNYKGLALQDVASLLKDPVHEHRLTALLILVEQFNKGDDSARAEIIDLYFSHTERINNWDLVDLSAPKIPGPWFYKRDKKPLYDYARSGNLWKERIAMLSTHYFIKKDLYDPTFDFADILFNHTHDLIHKAVGWMLREVGKRDGDAERAYLHKRYKKMPRTMLRYAIERFPEEERQKYLQGDV